MSTDSLSTSETFPVDRLLVAPTQSHLMRLLQPYLQEEEYVLWKGQPNPKIESGRYQSSWSTKRILFIVSLVLVSLSVYTFLSPAAAGAGVGIKLALVFLFGVPGLFTFACFLSSFDNLDRLVPQNTFYVITNRRAIRLYPQRPQLEEKFHWNVESFYPQEINIAVSYQSFDTGKYYNISFVRVPQLDGPDKWIGFNSVSEPEAVIEALRELRKLNSDAPLPRYDDSVPRLGLEAS